MISQEYLNQIQAETNAAVNAGWDGAKIEWRRMALEKLVEVCLTQKTFTVNDFRHVIKSSPIQTHDNRAMGGLMTTAKKLGWIALTGDEIPSRVGHRVPIQIWRSLIFTLYPNPRQLPDRISPIAFDEGKIVGDKTVYRVIGAKNKQYKVEYQRGVWSCECEGYRFSAKKICKHIIAIEKNIKLKQASEQERHQGKIF